MGVTESQPNAAPAAVGGNGHQPEAETVGVDKIRDLLFGTQMQDYDRRFAKLEERIQQRFKEVDFDTSRNLTTYELNGKKQVESLAAQIREEKELRADGDKEIERTLREQNQALEKRLRSMSDQISQLERELTDRLTAEALSLREDIKRKNEDLQNTIEKMFAELSNVKTDRNLLAGLFVEVAKCLNQETGPRNASNGAAGARGWQAG